MIMFIVIPGEKASTAPKNPVSILLMSLYDNCPRFIPITSRSETHTDLPNC